MTKNYHVIGLMSGTSLDGLDIACCDFSEEAGKWSYKINVAETLPYPQAWIDRLSGAESGTAPDLARLDVDFGHYCGDAVKTFIQRNSIHPDFIASHGHTIFHDPSRKLTLQIGKGAAIAAETGLTVINDFRSLDVALGGQGAPLVPIGDRLLFGAYDYCLNLGGFGNISFEREGERVAWDICPVNIVLNYLSRKKGKPYDPDGQMARSGKPDKSLLERLDSIEYYKKPFPKSLGKEWLIREFLPLIENSHAEVNDLLSTVCEHIAGQVAAATSHENKASILVTGGGALNAFLVESIRKATQKQVIIPDILTVNFKEALIFAFLGVLRLRGENNCLRTVTGAMKDNCGGAVWS